MSQSRVSQLLKQSRSRHKVVISKDLRKASYQWRTQKARSRQISTNLQKIVSEMQYYQSVNHRLTKELIRKKKDLGEAESVHSRFLDDNQKKRKLQELRQKQLAKNRQLAAKVKEHRLKKLEAVKQNIFEKFDRGNYYRNEKQRLRQQQRENQRIQFLKNQSRVEQIVQFQCSVKAKYIRKKENANNYFLKKYRKSIESERNSIDLKRNKTSQIRSRVRLLTQNTARRMSQLSEINVSLKKFNPRIPKTPLSSLSINKDKLLSKSRCYTMQNQTDEQPTITHDNSVVNSSHYTVN